MRYADAELFKDKIEVSLDGRQIFYLFFGGAVIVSLVFVLGVLVGKRLEARDHGGAMAAVPQNDPLAALDQLSAQSDQLTDVVDGEPQAVAMLPLDGSAVGAELDRAADEAAQRSAPAGPAQPEPGERAAAASKRDEAAAEKPEKPEKPASKPAAAEPAGAAEAEPAREPRFTLQISSFQAESEAGELRAKMAAAGYPAYVRRAEVEGKGIWFRVRVGKYATYDEAIAAKKMFEDDQHIIAYVTRL